MNSSISNDDGQTLWFGNMNPQAMEEFQSNGKEPKREDAAIFEATNNIFSVGFEYRKYEAGDHRPTNLEEMIEYFKEQERWADNSPAPKWLGKDVEIGNLIIVPPRGKNNPLRLIGRFSSEWYYKNEGLHRKLDTFNIRDVEDWVTVHKDELPENLQEHYARPVLQRCKKATDEEIKKINALYENKRK